MTMNTEILETLNSYKPAIADRYKDNVRRQYEMIVEKYGKKVNGVYTSIHYKLWNDVLAPVCVTGAGDSRVGYEKDLSEERLEKAADAYAELVIASWATKINSKLEEIDGGEVISLSGFDFNITGTRMGYKVMIVQQMIVKSSSKGKLFNQFPSRIYVDGKAMSEQEYKDMFATITEPKKEEEMEDKQPEEKKQSKMDIAREVMAEMKGQQRKEIIEEMMDRAELSKAAASTYYQKLK